MDEGRCAPFKPQHLQRGAHAPFGTPLTYLFVAKRAEKMLNFLHDISKVKQTLKQQL